MLSYSVGAAKLRQYMHFEKMPLPNFFNVGDTVNKPLFEKRVECSFKGATPFHYLQLPSY